MPTHGTANKLGLKAGETEATGSIWFFYYPTQMATGLFNSVIQARPTNGATTQSTTNHPPAAFISFAPVQKDLVRYRFDQSTTIWLLGTPNKCQNREWSALAGTLFDPFVLNVITRTRLDQNQHTSSGNEKQP